MNRERLWHTACAWKDEAIYVIGGVTGRALIGDKFHRNVYRLDLAKKVFTEAPSLNLGRCHASSCEANGKIYAFAGKHEKDDTKSMERLNIAEGARNWEMFSIHFSFHCPMVCALNENHVLITSGMAGAPTCLFEESTQSCKVI